MRTFTASRLDTIPHFSLDLEADSGGRMSIASETYDVKKSLGELKSLAEDLRGYL